MSDIRRSLNQYEVFRNAPFELGATGEAVAEDDTAVVIQALGNDGISYAIAPHVLDQEGVKIISMHQTLPDDPRYPLLPTPAISSSKRRLPLPWLRS